MILDTNIFIAAYWNKKSASARILRGCEQGRLLLVYSKPIEKEVFFILNRIKAKKPYQDYVAGLFANGRLVSPTKHVNLVKDDPDDNKYLDCALASNADYILSNDKHLLQFHTFRKTLIIRPAQFSI